MNLIWIGNSTLQEVYSFEKEDKDVVIAETVTSSKNLTFKVKNLVILGEIITEGNLSIHTQKDCFIGGVAVGENKIFEIKGTLYEHGLTDQALKKINNLGISIQKTEINGLSYRLPAVPCSLPGFPFNFLI